MRLLHKLIKTLIRAGFCLWALISSGCHSPMEETALPYGIPVPTKDPEVVIENFTYEPSQDLRVGDTIVFKATLNKHINEFDHGSVDVSFDNTPYPINRVWVSWLRDDGIAPDQAPGDGIYTGLRVLTSPCESLPVAAVYFDLERFADPLTVLPALEEE